MKSILIPLGLTCLCVSLARADYNPVPLTPGSFNADVVVEKTALPTINNYVTATLDGGTNNNGSTFFENGYDPNQPWNGVPVHGTTFSAVSDAGHQFKMPPDYTVNNGVLVGPYDGFTNGTLALTTPAAFTSLSVLCTAGNGPVNVNYTIHHGGGGTETGTMSIPDWTAGTNIAWYANGRLNLDNGGFASLAYTNGTNRRLLYNDITLTDTANNVTSVDFAFSGTSGRAVIFGLSGSTGAGFTPIAVTGFNKDLVIEATAPKVGFITAAQVTMDGGPVNNGFTFYEQGFNRGSPTTGVPTAGTSFTVGTHTFTMAASYTANNIVFIGNYDGYTSATITPTSAAAYTGLSFLNSCGNGPTLINVTVHHQSDPDETFTLTSLDWFDASTAIWTANGRFREEDLAFDGVNSGNCKLFNGDIALTGTSPVTSIGLSWSSGGRSFIFALSGSTGGNYNPIAFSGYNHDGIVEASAISPPLPLTTATTVSMDGGTNNNGNTWYEQGYYAAMPGSGLPAAGSTITSASLSDHHYQMPSSYTANNAIYVDSTHANANLRIATPYAYSALSFLSACANGWVSNACIVQYADGTQETNYFVSQDWFNNSPFAFSAYGRVNLDNRTINNDPGRSGPPSNPRFYEAQFALGNIASPVTNVVLEFLSAQNATSGRMVVMAVSGLRAGYYPMVLTPSSYNADVIVEKSATPPVVPGGYTTASMDNGTANGGDTWCEMGLFASDPSVGLPAAGTTITDLTFADHSYTFAPSWKANNTIMLDATSFSGLYTFTLATPALYGKLTFLTSGGNGGCLFRWTAHHADSTTETGTQPSADWFNGANQAFIANVRANAQSYTRDNYNSGNPRLYGKDVTLANTTSPVTSIDLQYVSSAGGAHTCIMAVSGQAPGGGNFNPIAVTGYNADIVVEASVGPLTDTGTLPSAPLTTFTTFSMDGGTANTGNTWYEQGYVPAYPLTGLPPAGSILVSTNLPDHSYQLAADYTQPNAIYVDFNNPAAQITFANPTPFSAMSFLSANANGAMGLGVAIGHADGVWETNYFTSQDWFNYVPAAFTANGRIDLDNGVINNLNGGNPRLYEAQFPLTDTASPVTSAWLLWTNDNATGTSRTVVLAVSGTAGAVAPIINTQPASVAVSAGANVSFTVGVLGTGPFTYKWQAAGATGVYTNLTDGAGISGSSTSTLSLTAVTTDSSGVKFRVVVTNAGGSVTSQPATLTVYSTLANMATPSDTIVSYPAFTGPQEPGGEKVVHAIDDSTSKWLNFGLNDGSPYLGPAGCVWTPSAGSVIISGIRIFTANDAPERDPANFILEGSNDGGSHFSLISSNQISLPDTRNAGGATIDMATQAFAEVDFHNTVGYTTYRLTFTLVKNNAAANSTQMGEVQFLGVVNPSTAPLFTQSPQSLKVYDGTSASFTVSASGTPAPAYAWARGANGVYTLLSDGGNISGSQTALLTVNPATYSDAVNYICIATNTFGAATSSVATLSIVSLLTNVIYTTDPILTFGDEAVAGGGGPLYPNDVGLNLIDNTPIKWQNGGSGFSTSAGFPPFQGPVGVVLTNETADMTALRPTLVVGMRIFTADGNPERDPADYMLEGSLDGNTFSPIASGALNLPLDRNSAAVPIDPIADAEQEVFFSNYKTYPIYRVTFNNTRNDTAANSMQIAEMQLLGVDASVVVPVLTVTRGTTPGTIKITTSVPAELYSTTNIASGNWVDEGPISGSITITPTPGTPQKYYRLGLY